MSSPLSNPFLNLMCNMHISQTTLANPPFKLIVPFDISQLDIDKMELVTSSKEEFDKFVKICSTQFVIKYKELPYGSVHLAPNIWTQFAIKTIQHSLNTKSDQLVFPNGCCSQELSCPINLFYQFVLSNLLVSIN